jgi:hypothetical protein
MSAKDGIEAFRQPKTGNPQFGPKKGPNWFLGPKRAQKYGPFWVQSIIIIKYIKARILINS